MVYLVILSVAFKFVCVCACVCARVLAHVLTRVSMHMQTLYEIPTQSTFDSFFNIYGTRKMIQYSFQVTNLAKIVVWSTNKELVDTYYLKRSKL